MKHTKRIVGGAMGGGPISTIKFAQIVLDSRPCVPCVSSLDVSVETGTMSTE
jgi:hypothetical protein